MAVSSQAFESVVSNIGVATSPSSIAAESILGNVGVASVPSAGAFEAMVGQILDGGAAPMIFALVPSAARGGDGISVIGSGFGATQLERAGVVETFNGLTWEAMSVNSWARIPASADASTANRVIDPAGGVFDPEHEQIDVSVPSWAVPPSVQIRVRTTA
jgi:hypothetical protein